MKQSAFERLGEVRWRAFEDVLERARVGNRLPKDVDPVEFADDYQLITRDLSIARARGYSRLLVERLNRLARSGHNIMYVRRSGFVMGLLRFVASGFPRAVRREWPYVLVASLLFAVPLFGMAAAVLIAPELVYSVMSAGQVSSMEAMYDPASERFGRERGSASDLYMFAFYIYNNIGISFQVFATGIVAGIGTIFYILYNGVYIGAVAGHLIGVGFSDTFLSFVVGHGSFELTAIALSGAAGLMLGHALIAPGERRRRDALIHRGREAVQIVFGATLMLLIAAFVEAFWSSITSFPSLVKYVVGLALWVLVIGYLVVAGRRA